MMAEKVPEPTRIVNAAIGYVLTSTEDKVVKGRTRETIQTTLWIVFPDGYLGRTIPGPSLSDRPEVSVNLDYSMEEIKGNIPLAVSNPSDEELVISIGDQIADLTWVKEFNPRPRTKGLKRSVKGGYL